MALLTTWSPYFQARDRQRGRGYFQEGQVHRQPPEEGEVVRAQVTGQDGAHTVTFHSDGSATTAQCTCPQSSSGVFCAHIWAALVAVQEGNGEFVGGMQPGALTNPRPPRARKRSEDRPSVLDAQPAWATRLDMIRPTALEQRRFEPPPVLAHYRVCYVVRPALSLRHHGLVIDLVREPWGDGGWAYAKPKRIKVSLENVGQLPDAEDRQLCGLLLGAQPVVGHHEDGDDWTEHDRGRATTRFVLSPAAQGSLLEKILGTGRCFVEDPKAREILDSPLTWGGDEPWVLWLKGERVGEGLEVDLELRRGDRVVGLDQPVLVLPGASGLVIDADKVSPLDDCGAFTWVVQFRDGHQPSGGQAKLTVPAEDVSRFLDRLYRLPQLPRLDLPEGVGYPEQRVTPTACLELWHLSDTTTDAKSKQRRFLAADVSFDYAQQRVKPHQPGWFVSAVPTASGGAPVAGGGNEPVLIHRDVRFEAEAMALLGSLGFRRSASADANLPALLVSARRVPEVVATLIGRGWSVMADQKALRRPAAPVMSVKTGIDWFELRGGVKYQTSSGEVEVGLPEILAAARAGREMVSLSDGSQGVLPQQWLEENGLLAAIGQVHEDHVRFRSTQAMILDSLLSQQPTVSVDEKFAAVRERLQRLHNLGSVEPTSRFQGHLRSYQNEGLVWLEYLRAVGLGGILADDMGLGKTVQVLAMLDRVYSGGGSATAPTLIVVPRSIVFNWLDEAARFTPHLKAQGYTGAERHALREAFADHHVIVTTYGLLRRDIAELGQHCFEYLVLDEAQAIKNPDSQSAQAARMLKANHRLALTGTPVENHLGDLWSIFEYLNPGMLGSNARFAKLIRSVVGGRRGAMGLEPTRAAKREAAQSGGGGRVAPITKAMGPFILRRTKQQVLRDLPEKTEQTIVCQMELAQRAVYDQLLTHYRSALLGRRPGRGGGGGAFGGGSVMMVLEALLRLRQAACHPGLIDQGRADQPSAKLDVLMDRLADLVEEGHKALVFSQFTSLLAIVRKRLDDRGMVYEYLDGQTKDRAGRVERFQTDPHCPVFLISLKAGGLGLNLTAAEYVFILDPWWNPAVEAQAVDRAHRIGQSRHVFAYRLICQDTVEQRIAELQQRKRTLAEAVVGGQEEGVLASLSREDLQYLLT